MPEQALSVRVDDDTASKLDQLVDHYSREQIRPATVSDVVRHAIRELHAQELDG